MPASSVLISRPASVASKASGSMGFELATGLTIQQGQTLLHSFDRNTLRGKRDYAMVAVLLGCGLRRAELSSAKVENLQRREEHWVFP